MKENLKTKYLPVSYHQRMLDDWQNLKQGSKPVSEYIAKFDEYMSRCDVMEDEVLTLSPFRSGLREDLRRELILREIYIIQDAYEMVQNFDSLSTQSRRFESITRTPSYKKFTTSPATSSKFNSELNKGKTIYKSDIVCHHCHKPGHIKSQCPQRTLIIGADGN